MVRPVRKERSAADVAAGIALALFATGLHAAPWKLPCVKPRIVVETDAPGGDPDDEAPLVRFFPYLNEWDVEVIIATRAAAPSRLGISGKQRVRQYVDDYANVRSNLREHTSRFPEPQHLRRHEFSCAEGTEARDAVLSILDRDDPRPVWYLNCGTSEEDSGGELHDLQERDAPMFTHLIPNGLGDSHRRQWVGWCWRFEFSTKLNARWCVRSKKNEANHAPVPALQGDVSTDVLLPNGVETLSAEGSADPDGDSLRFEWIVYREAGSYAGQVAIQAEGATAR